jgi:hypothetical protein
MPSPPRSCMCPDPMIESWIIPYDTISIRASAILSSLPHVGPTEEVCPYSVSILAPTQSSCKPFCHFGMLIYDLWRSAQPVPVPFLPQVDEATAFGIVLHLNLSTWICAPPSSASYPSWYRVSTTTKSLALHYFVCRSVTHGEEVDFATNDAIQRVDAIADILVLKLQDSKVVDVYEEDVIGILQTISAVM